MPLSWNEIRLQASSFVKEWEERAPKAKEEADAQDFQTDFLKVFGVTRRQVATFEHRVEMTDRRGYIDLFWKGRIMIEMKSPGKDRIKAYEQAKEYAANLPPKELPLGILISYFLTFDYYNFEKNNEKETFALSELPQKAELFVFLAGYKDVSFEAVSPVEILHNLIFQQRSTDAENSDLWFINEEYIYYQGFSDIHLSTVKVGGKKIFKEAFSPYTPIEINRTKLPFVSSVYSVPPCEEKTNQGVHFNAT